MPILRFQSILIIIVFTTGSLSVVSADDFGNKLFPPIGRVVFRAQSSFDDTAFEQDFVEPRSETMLREIPCCGAMAMFNGKQSHCRPIRLRRGRLNRCACQSPTCSHRAFCFGCVAMRRLAREPGGAGSMCLRSVCCRGGLCSALRLAASRRLYCTRPPANSDTVHTFFVIVSPSSV